MKLTSTKTGLVATALCAVTFSACVSVTTQKDTRPMSAAEKTAPAAPGAVTGTITVNVSGFETQQGRIMAALVDKTGYDGGKPLRGQMSAINGETVQLTFEDIPAGTYAIRMFHDVDGNGEMNQNAFGIPTEPYAFSNNAAGQMGPAPWERAKFDVSADGAVQNITF